MRYWANYSVNNLFRMHSRQFDDWLMHSICHAIGVLVDAGFEYYLWSDLKGDLILWVRDDWVYDFSISLDNRSITCQVTEWVMQSLIEFVTTHCVTFFELTFGVIGVSLMEWFNADWFANEEGSSCCECNFQKSHTMSRHELARTPSWGCGLFKKNGHVRDMA